jgi:hypothetical protein
MKRCGNGRGGGAELRKVKKMRRIIGYKILKVVTKGRKVCRDRSEGRKGTEKMSRRSV